mgnify:CR=1 FL=1
MKYSFTSRIRYSEIGEDGNLTLPGLINYFQDCSTFQFGSDRRGRCGAQKTRLRLGAVRVADSCAPLSIPW